MESMWERRCALTDEQAMAEAGCRIPAHEARLGIDETFLSQWSQGAIVNAFERGVNLWANVANIKVSVELGHAETLIRPVYGRIDGPSGVVAWSHLPCPYNPPLLQRYDDRENWSLDFNPSSGLSFPNVVAHEVGHALGLGHGPSNNIMNATIQNHLLDLGPWDRRQIIDRYGPVGEPGPEEPEMNRFFACILGVLPEVLACLFQGEQEAAQKGEEGPVTWFIKTMKK